jgi:hypothetical protein
MGTTTTGYTLIKASTPFINGTALWHIIVVSVAAGAGLAVAFGLILLGLKYGQVGKDSAAKAGGWILGVAAAAFCVGAIVVGIYAMLHPSKSKPLKVVPSSSSSSALVVSHHSPTG